MPSVLVINDDPSALTTMTASLRCAGIDTATADTGSSGVALASERLFDVLLVDLRLPDISGIEVIRRLKRRGVAARMVIVTAFPSLDTSFEAGAEGADGYVDGPLFDDEIVGVVRHAMDRPCGQRELTTRTAEPIDPRIHKVMRIIQENISDPPPPAELARRVELSDSRLRHLFASAVGTTIPKYILERRLAAAARVLASTFEHVRQIAFSVGLDDVRLFRKAFRSRYGFSPKEYRRQFGLHRSRRPQ